MLPDRFRHWAHNGLIPADGPGDAEWQVADWDSRRWFRVVGPSDVYGDEDGENICKALLPHAADLPLDITKVTLTSTGEVKSTLNNPEDDWTAVVFYPSFTIEAVGSDASDCVKRSDLEEEDRLHIFVDLVRLMTSKTTSQQLVFKYTMLQAQVGPLWREAFFIKRLQDCPYVVPFDKFVVHETEPLFLGFTTAFMPGRSLQDNPRVFRGKWLEQIFEVVDRLNLEYGIVHQDISPRNLCIDPETDDLVVIDFGLAAFIGSKEEDQKRNDVDAVVYTLYEILTGDKHFREDVWPGEYNVNDVESMEEWPLRAELEPGLDAQMLRSMVLEWAQNRRQNIDPRALAHVVDIPEMPLKVNGSFAVFDEDHPAPIVVKAEEGRLVRGSNVSWLRTPQSKLHLEQL